MSRAEKKTIWTNLLNNAHYKNVVLNIVYTVYYTKVCIFVLTTETQK